MAVDKNSELFLKVAGVIEKLRPYLQNDGGDIELIEISDDNIVYVKLKGACGSCPYSVQTLKQGVETSVIKEVPEIKAVESI